MRVTHLSSWLVSATAMLYVRIQIHSMRFIRYTWTHEDFEILRLIYLTNKLKYAKLASLCIVFLKLFGWLKP